MKALFYTGTQASEIRDTDAPVAATGETLVDLAFCGICGSDMHAWHGKLHFLSRCIKGATIRNNVQSLGNACSVAVPLFIFGSDASDLY